LHKPTCRAKHRLDMRKNIRASTSAQKRRRVRPRRSKMSGPNQSTDTKLIPYNANIVLTDQHRLRSSVDGIYKCKRSFIAAPFTQILASEIFGAIVGQLSFCNDVASLLGVFDSYRIVGMEIEFKCVAGENFTSEAGTFTTVLDYDDAAALTTLQQALDYSSAITTKARENHRRCFVPKIAPAVFQSGVLSGYANATNQWINSTSTTVQHYGVKYALDPCLVLGSAMTITPFCTLELEFRASR